MCLSIKLTESRATCTHHVVTTPAKPRQQAIPRSSDRINLVLGLVFLSAAISGCHSTEPSGANAPVFFSEFKQCLAKAEADGADAPTRSQCHWDLQTRRQEVSI